MTSKKARFPPRKLKNPLVSIVMTIYNEAHVVDEAIRTLLDQSYKNIELILVNNGSKDTTSSVIRKYAKRKDVKILGLEKNLGPGGGRNAGAKAASGDILIFIDADMVFDKKYVEGLIAPVIAGKTIGTFHDTELVKNKEHVWARSFSVNRIENPGEISGVFRAVLREPFLAIGGFDTSRGYFDDHLGALGVSSRAHATCYHNNPENLAEIFSHSRWVGRSLIQDPHNRDRFGVAVLLSWIGIATVMILTASRHFALPGWLAGIALAPLLLFVLVKGLGRAMKDGYPEFVITVPIVWVVRILGYWLGATGEIIRRAFGRKR